MSKTKTTFYCQNCGTQSSKWVGKCPSCNEWNTFVEEIVQKDTKNNRLQLFTGNKNAKGETNKPVLLQEIGTAEYPRIAVPGKELTRVLGGGIVPGSMVLFGGEPGIGKSTLMLQLALRLKI
jgi:DNA repair protein RadA/Sms